MTWRLIRPCSRDIRRFLRTRRNKWMNLIGRSGSELSSRTRSPWRSRSKLSSELLLTDLSHMRRKLESIYKRRSLKNWPKRPKKLDEEAWWNPWTTQFSTRWPDKTLSEDPELKKSMRRRTKSKDCQESYIRRTMANPEAIKFTIRRRTQKPLKTTPKIAVNWSRKPNTSIEKSSKCTTKRTHLPRIIMPTWKRTLREPPKQILKPRWKRKRTLIWRSL